MAFGIGFLPLLLAATGPYLAEGVKVGEVTDSSAIVWVRLSAKPQRVPAPFPPGQTKGRPAPLPEGADVAAQPGAVPGMAGRVRLRCAGRWTAWASVNESTDFTHQFPLPGLKPAQRYDYEVETSGGARFQGSFRTAPSRQAAVPVRFVVVTCLMYRDLDHADGFLIYEAMRRDPPDFVVMNGDDVYYDSEAPRATTPAAARYHWQRMYSLPRHVALQSLIPMYWTKDDHDTLSDDVYPTLRPDFMLPMTFEQGQRIFLQQAPMGPRTYRSFRWGKHLEVWLLEGRDFRSANNAPDGPEKTILGAGQKRWLKSTVEASDARWRIIVSPTPWVGPDRPNKRDNYSNASFACEGSEMRAWAAALKNVIVMNGDRHWQYHSVDPKTGLHEFSCGAVSDQHAGGTPGENHAYHRFHRLAGGYVMASIAADGSLVFTHHDVNGKTIYRYPF